MMTCQRHLFTIKQDKALNKPRGNQSDTIVINQHQLTFVVKWTVVLLFQRWLGALVLLNRGAACILEKLLTNSRKKSNYVCKTLVYLLTKSSFILAHKAIEKIHTTEIGESTSLGNPLSFLFSLQGKHHHPQWCIWTFPTNPMLSRLSDEIALV